jgi:O-antigen ligase
VRAFAPVHNLYLLVLCETGLLGLAAFALLLGCALARGVSAVIRTRGIVQGICLGILAGLAVQCVQQTLDFSLWFDSSWYTFALLLALLVRAPVGGQSHGAR